MRILLDECCPPALATALRRHGHDVLHALEHGTGHSDDSQAQAAYSDNRVVVTADYDFADMAIRDTIIFIGLVILAPDLGNLRSEAEAIATRISGLGDVVRGDLTILESAGVRARRLPSRY